MYSIGSPDVYLYAPTLYCSMNDSCEMNDESLAASSVPAGGRYHNNVAYVSHVFVFLRVQTGVAPSLHYLALVITILVVQVYQDVAYYYVQIVYSDDPLPISLPSQACTVSGKDCPVDSSSPPPLISSPLSSLAFSYHSLTLLSLSFCFCMVIGYGDD